jgi:cytoskeletal protein CcmA (bactofilin family)
MKRVLQLMTAFVLVSMLVLVPLQPAAAKGLLDGQVIFGQSFTLASGQTMHGDLVVFGGSATVEDGAKVDGNTVLFGGSLIINGEVSGDVALVGGSVTLGAHAHVHGNLSTVGASLVRADGSQVDGQIYNTATSWVGNASAGNRPVNPSTTPMTPIVPNIHISLNPFAAALNAFGQALGLGLLAMLLMLFLAPHAQRVAQATARQPLIAGGLGLLTIVAAIIALVALALFSILIITLIVTVPLIIVISLALSMAAVFGWIAIGLEIGERFTKAIHQEWHPALAAGLGTFALTLICSALTGIPVLNCIGWLVPFVLGLAALGAVVMTRFGTRSVLDLAPTPIAPPQGNPPAG